MLLFFKDTLAVIVSTKFYMTKPSKKTKKKYNYSDKCIKKYINKHIKCKRLKEYL